MPERQADPTPEPSGTFWSGTITFGLVSVPVSLVAANRSQGVSLRMVSRDGRPLSRRYFTSRDEKPLEWDEIVRGYEVEKDRYVVLTDDELERLAPERTRDIDLRVFVPVEQLDPKYFDRAYYLVPASGSTKAYRLLARVMEETGRAGIATFVMRAKEYLIAILAENGILRAETLRFADELRTPESIGLPEPVKASPARVRAIEKEIAAHSKPRLDPRELVDHGAERLLELVQKKAGSGEDVVEVDTDGEEEASSEIIDLMEMLQRSLSGGSGRGGSATGRDGRTGAGSNGAGSRGGKELESASKAELYERAKALDIPGRSGMSRDELIEAIRRSA